MRKILIVSLVLLLIGCSTAVSKDDIYEVEIEMQIGNPIATVNGLTESIDENDQVVPFIQNDRTLVPLRFITKHLGLEVTWDETEERITLKNSDVEIVLTIGKSLVYVNGIEKRVDCSPILRADRTFVPLRFISENLYCEISWEEATQTILIQKEKEKELNINNEDVQALYHDILNKNEFASYYHGKCDVELLDSPQNIWGGTMRQLISLLKLEEIEEKEYTREEAEAVITEFLSHGDISVSLSEVGLDDLKNSLENSGNYGKYSQDEILVASLNASVLDDISIDLFGKPLPKYENMAYSIGYHSFFLYNRVNLVYPWPEMTQYGLYYNSDGKQYLFTKYRDSIDFTDEESLQSEMKLLKATEHNGKISLYLYREAQFNEYTAGTSSYRGVYRNTYQKTDDGYIWLYSYGTDRLE